MAQYIDPSRITVVKDSDGRSQSTLNQLFSKNDNDYYSSKSGDLNKTKTVSIYFKLDKPTYVSQIDIASPKGSHTPTRFYLYATDENFSNSVSLGYFTRSSSKEGAYTQHFIDKDKIKKYQYFRLYLYEATHGTKDWYMQYYVKAKLYGESSMPKYIMKNVNGDYFYAQDNTIVTIAREDITEDILMDDVNNVTKENLELVKDKFKVLRILVP